MNQLEVKVYNGVLRTCNGLAIAIIGWQSSLPGRLFLETFLILTSRGRVSVFVFILYAAKTYIYSCNIQVVSLKITKLYEQN